MNARGGWILHLHAAGWSQRDIASEVGITQTAVRRVLVKCGMPANGHSTPRSRAKHRAACIAFCRRNGVPSLGHISGIARRLKAIRRAREREGL